MTRADPSVAGRPGIPITAATRIAAVIGDPVAHSLSPALHNAAFAAAGIDAVYVAARVASHDLADAIRGMRAAGYLGASVTVPHKRRAADLCDRLAAPADAIGAVNCLVFAGGEIVGHNTDAGGFTDALAETLGRPPTGRAVLLGAGGAARAVAAGLAAVGIESDVVARRPQAVAWTAAHPWTAAALDALLPGCDALVDCTSAALHAGSETELPAPVPLDRLGGRLDGGAVVASLVYHREPALLAAARERGLATMDGAGMLIHQGARAFSLWTGVAAPLAAMREAMRRALSARSRVSGDVRHA